MTRFGATTRLATTLAGGLLALAAVGCGETGGGDSLAAGCARASEIPANTPMVALLVQQGTGGAENASTQRQAFETVIDGTTEMQARLLLGGIGPDPSAATLVADTSLVAEGSNDLLREKALECRQQSVRDGYDKLASGLRSEKVDLVSALRSVDGSLADDADRPVDLVVLGSALNTAGVDLRDRAMLKAPARGINELARQGLNFRCDGWRIHVVGSSAAAGRAASGALDAQLREWWREWAAHCGGQLVYYAPQLSEFPLDSGAIARADYSTIPIRIKRHRGVVEATLSGDVLFAVNSAELMDEADAALRKLLPALPASTGTIHVAGYTDSTGTDEINGPLSARRAGAVADWIVRVAGLDRARIRARGYGSREPVASNATAEGRATNRRVTVTMRTTRP